MSYRDRLNLMQTIVHWINYLISQGIDSSSIKVDEIIEFIEIIEIQNI